MKILFLCCALVLAAACGKDGSSNSSSNVFSSNYGTAQTADGYVVMPRAGQAGQLYIEAGGRQYTIGQMSSQAQQVLQQMAAGYIQPTSINNQIVKFRARITGSAGSYGGYSGGYGGTGYYPGGGYQQPVNSNVLNVQSLQPF